MNATLKADLQRHVFLGTQPGRFVEAVGELEEVRTPQLRILVGKLAHSIVMAGARPFYLYGPAFSMDELCYRIVMYGVKEDWQSGAESDAPADAETG